MQKSDRERSLLQNKMKPSLCILSFIEKMGLDAIETIDRETILIRCSSVEHHTGISTCSSKAKRNRVVAVRSCAAPPYWSDAPDAAQVSLVNTVDAFPWMGSQRDLSPARC